MIEPLGPNGVLRLHNLYLDTISTDDAKRLSALLVMEENDRLFQHISDS